MPLYNIISFSTIPYAQAKQRALAQARTLKVIGWSAVGAIVALAAKILAAAAF